MVDMGTEGDDEEDGEEWMKELEEDTSSARGL